MRYLSALESVVVMGPFTCGTKLAVQCARFYVLFTIALVFIALLPLNAYPFIILDNLT